MAVKEYWNTMAISVCRNQETVLVSTKDIHTAGYADRFHVHVHRTGDNDEILFRDYLIAHSESAKEYETLKLSLLPEYRNNRDGYTEAKTEFVKKIVSQLT